MLFKSMLLLVALAACAVSYSNGYITPMGPYNDGLINPGYGGGVGVVPGRVVPAVVIPGAGVSGYGHGGMGGEYGHGGMGGEYGHGGMHGHGHGGNMGSTSCMYLPYPVNCKRYPGTPGTPTRLTVMRWTFAHGRCVQMISSRVKYECQPMDQQNNIFATRSDCRMYCMSGGY